MDWVESVCAAGNSLPSNEQFGLTSQLWRAAVSAPANVAEGHGRRSTKAFLNHPSISFESLMELETCLRISGRLGYASDEKVSQVIEQSQELGRMLNGLVRSLGSSDS